MSTFRFQLTADDGACGYSNDPAIKPCEWRLDQSYASGQPASTFTARGGCGEPFCPADRIAVFNAGDRTYECVPRFR